jgi:transposase InsO family protein
MKVLAAMPIRKIPISNRAVTGLHARSGARYESSLERDFFELMMADPAVDKVEEQPVKIIYITDDGESRRYTPDALVTFHPNSATGRAVLPLLCEIKYRDEYKEKFLELKGRFRVARRYARERGWRFRVVTDREIRTPRFATLRFLGGFKDRIPGEDQVQYVLGALPADGSATPATLLASLSPDIWKQAELLPILWWLVANETQRRYLFVAIDRATRWVFLHIYNDMTDRSSVDFLRRLKLASPIKIIKLLTDNGSQFTDRFSTKDKKPSGQHAFDNVCAGMGIEHRLAPPRHPQTNGMVERFNGRISELLQQTRFDSRADLETTLLNYLKLYNHHIPQRAIGVKTPIQALKEWQQAKPELFVKRVYDQTGLDSYAIDVFRPGATKLLSSEVIVRVSLRLFDPIGVQ